MTDQPNKPEHTPPNSIEAEEAVLGAVLISPEILVVLMTILSADDFFIARHMWVWEVFIDLHQQNMAIDNITIINELKARGQLSDIGGPAYITYLINNCPTHIHAVTYAKLVERAAIRRRLLNASGDIAQMALEENADIAKVLDRAESTLHLVTRMEMSSAEKEQTFEESMDEHYAELEARYNAYNAGQTMSGLPTGLTDLDQITGGLQGGDFDIFASRPSHGKSALALTIVLNIIKWAIENNIEITILFDSLEMSKKSLINRMVGIEAGLNSEKVRTGGLVGDDWSAYTTAWNKMRKYPLIIDDTPNMPLTYMENKARAVARKNPLGLIIVDYIQLMKAETKRDNRPQEVTELSQRTKGLARELNVPILALAQTNRDIETRPKNKDGNRVPIMSDLAESAALERDADLIGFLVRPEMWDSETDRPSQADLYIAKHRNGPTGMLSLFYRREITQFCNMSKRTINIEDIAFGKNGGTQRYVDED